MDLELKEKVALVTGSGQGVGREIAKVLAEEGAKVAVNDFFAERADAVAEEIIKSGRTAMGVQADITNLDQVMAMVATIKDALGPVDILVNNAGVPIPIRSGQMARTVFAESDPIAWQKQIDLNMYGCLNCTHAVIHSMIERKEGKILSVISEAGRVGEVNLAVYSGAKAGILGFSKALAREVGRYRINVNCIAIGATAHEGTKPLLDPDATPETDEILNKMLKAYPIGKGMGRIGRPSDAAYAIAFLASSKAAFITGQCLSVNGGFSMVS
ncbi:MAG: SDR family NAD(P)-dependent oxidoreductase [Deltaproteobacteria bacterium]|nr:SDR family NAD(P)-dependent oxidoreductase [Deltaproteobacteria bacterium]MBW1923785.1 SDR family NAD(P)-dependent oxidoreductase [Deltaproteobacteria bacterium]MBW1949042.1 SDR family NAD(P)-dependent oxidoreductase [Deltaproteobacteria bacterium]MBW2008566.1 SDR family NAD(P)-dependent oxidoreductase [Deltaproteobacteria bacterium]MBW2103215.1 SDR family NAD(P)-dependent oxidoreductase [Deltaproteobacteria bacterium]